MNMSNPTNAMDNRREQDPEMPQDVTESGSSNGSVAALPFSGWYVGWCNADPLEVTLGLCRDRTQNFPSLAMSIEGDRSLFDKANPLWLKSQKNLQNPDTRTEWFPIEEMPEFFRAPLEAIYESLGMTLNGNT